MITTCHNSKPPATSEDAVKGLMGGKGLSLFNMTQEGMPVPPWVNVPTTYCTPGTITDDTYEEILAKVEETFGHQVGSVAATDRPPLLVSVRSGAPVSMPGMMETVLNVGLHEGNVTHLANTTNADFAWDCYRRLVTQFATIVRGRDSEFYTETLAQARAFLGTKNLPAEMNAKLVKLYLKDEPDLFPQDPWVQLRECIDKVFNSWYGPKAIAYREIENIPESIGTAVNIQQMVFGNLNDKSGTGIFFTRNPNTGEGWPYGEFLWNAQGEDVVSGHENTLDIEELPSNPRTKLVSLGSQLEMMYGNAMDIEFTIEDGELFLLQARPIKAAPKAGIRITLDLMSEDVLTTDQAAERIAKLTNIATAETQPEVSGGVEIGTGIACSPGIVTGRACVTLDEIEAANVAGDFAIFVAPLTTPDDIVPMSKADGILTMNGGPTCHAAVTARGWGKACVVGLDPTASFSGKSIKILGNKIKRGALISIDGSTGEVVSHG